MSEVNPEEVYVVRCGNHWLQTVPTEDFDKLDHYGSLSAASYHTKEWVEETFGDVRRVEIMTLAEAMRREREEVARNLKSRWLNLFEMEVRAKYEGFTTQGLWTAAHMYHGQGLTIAQALKEFGGPGGPKIKLKATPASLPVKEE